MAEVTIRVDDLDATVLDEDLPPVRFSFGEEFYSIDLNPPNKEALRKLLEPYIEKARREDPPSLRRAVNSSYLTTKNKKIRPPSRIDKNHRLADRNGHVSLAKEIICKSLGNNKMICFWCDKTIISNASKATASTFVVSFLDKNPLHYKNPNIEPAHPGCNRGWLASRNSALSDLYAQKIKDRLENGPLWNDN